MVVGWIFYLLLKIEKNWLWIWENANDRNQFEKEFEAEDPEVSAFPR